MDGRISRTLWACTKVTCFKNADLPYKEKACLFRCTGMCKKCICKEGKNLKKINGLVALLYISKVQVTWKSLRCWKIELFPDWKMSFSEQWTRRCWTECCFAFVTDVPVNQLLYCLCTVNCIRYLWQLYVVLKCFLVPTKGGSRLD